MKTTLHDPAWSESDRAEAEAVFNSSTHCHLCGRKFGVDENRSLLPGRRLGTFLVACEGDEDCPMKKRPWKPVPPKP